MTTIQFYEGGDWETVATGTWAYCQGFADAAVQLRPGLRVRLVMADERVVEWPAP